MSSAVAQALMASVMQHVQQQQQQHHPEFSSRHQQQQQQPLNPATVAAAAVAGISAATALASRDRGNSSDGRRSPFGGNSLTRSMPSAANVPLQQQIQQQLNLVSTMASRSTTATTTMLSSSSSSFLPDESDAVIPDSEDPSEWVGLPYGYRSPVRWRPNLCRPKQGWQGTERGMIGVARARLSAPPPPAGSASSRRGGSATSARAKSSRATNRTVEVVCDFTKAPNVRWVRICLKYDHVICLLGCFADTFIVRFLFRPSLPPRVDSFCPENSPRRRLHLRHTHTPRATRRAPLLRFAGFTQEVI